ncbi:hypothetical protein ACEPAG_9485 [Sanghuangporus baumii]
MFSVGHPYNASSSKGKQSTPPPDVSRVFCSDYVEDSPAKLRNSHTKKYQEGDLSSMREAVREEVGPFIPEISLNDFMKYLLPPMKDWIDLPEVVALLEEEGDVITSSGKKVFKTFEKAPKNRKEHEDTVFAPLVDIYGKICRHATRDDARVIENFVLAMLSNITPTSERGVRQRPDAGLIPKRLEEFARVAMAKKGETKDEKRTRERRKRVLMAEGKIISWYDIAMAYEMKLEEIIDQRNDNAEKGIFHLQQTATLDACRRFTFGATIENRMMRLWFSSRGTLVVSKPFDFTTRISDLAHVFLSLAFASEEELGWDPTVQAIMVSENERVYCIKVKDRMYMTKKTLEDVAADSLLSSGTRVWEVIDVDSGETRILKDTWVENDRALESVIYGMMLEDVQREHGLQIRNFVASHLVTPLMDWLVPVNGSEDHTVTVMMRGYTPPVDEVFKLKVEKPTNREVKRSDGPPKVSGSRGHKIRSTKAKLEECARRKHYRIVYAEVAEPIYKAEKLSDSFIALRDAAACLKYLHGSDWVHRDLSVGNLYLYHGRGLIGDLEYARCKTSKAVAHRMRTASIYFMAAETIQRAYLYKPTSPNRPAIGLQGTFFHNDLHDMESLLWIALYQVFRQSDAYESDTVDQEESERRGEEQDIAASLLFPDSNVIDITQRLLCLKEPENFLRRVSWMPEKLEGIKISLDMLRNELIESYTEFEEKFPMLQMHALQRARDAAEENFGACVNLALQIESASAPPFPILEDDLDERETSAHSSPQAQAGSLFIFNQKSSRSSEENEEHAPESPTPCRTGKRKRVDQEPSPERHLSKPR